MRGGSHIDHMSASHPTQSRQHRQLTKHTGIRTLHPGLFVLVQITKAMTCEACRCSPSKANQWGNQCTEKAGGGHPSGRAPRIMGAPPKHTQAHRRRGGHRAAKPNNRGGRAQGIRWGRDARPQGRAWKVSRFPAAEKKVRSLKGARRERSASPTVRVLNNQRRCRSCSLRMGRRHM